MSKDVFDVELAEGLSEIIRSRGNVYALLSRCYETEMDVTFAAEIADRFSFQSDNAVLSGEMDAMRDCLRAIDDDGLEMLAVAFDRVFFGMGPLTAKKAFPYESVYTSRKGLLMQEAFVETAKVYRANRLQKSADFREPEDHLAVQLAFMKALCDRAGEALATRDMQAAEEALAEQRAFLQEHLLNWVPRFAIEAEEAAEQGFYAHLARFTPAFLREDEMALADILGIDEE